MYHTTRLPADCLKMSKLAKAKGATEQKESTEEIESHMSISIVVAVIK